MITSIPHSRPFVGNAEKAACGKVILSRQLSQGPCVEMLEHELSSVAGHKFGICVSSGTAALYCALKALGVSPGNSVVIPSYVCTALLNAVILAGADPVLSDVDPATGNMDPHSARKAVRRATRAIIVPHLFGVPAAAHEIERSTGIPVIEDCAQCVGTTIGGEKIGSLTTISIFSFYATKLLCAGEGGMAATSDARLAAKLADMREYDNRDRYVPSFNFKLSDVHAAIALVQLKKLPAAIRRRKAVAREYLNGLKPVSPRVRLPDSTAHASSVFYRFVALVDQPISGILRKSEKSGVSCRRPIYGPLHHYLKKTGFPGTDEIYKRAISLPIYPDLTQNEISQVKQVFLRAIGAR
jgi:dTDP-4-amino-4,6-dideoxygalactose transaminase